VAADSNGRGGRRWTTTATIPGAGIYSYGYDVHGKLESITTTGGFGGASFGYQGPLLTAMSTTGPQSVADGTFNT
jgi:hypothetical protein